MPIKAQRKKTQLSKNEDRLQTYQDESNARFRLEFDKERFYLTSKLLQINFHYLRTNYFTMLLLYRSSEKSISWNRRMKVKHCAKLD